MRSPRSRLFLAVVLTAVAIAPLGCGKTPKTVATSWPKVERERVVPEPPRDPVWPLTGLDAPSEDAMESRVVSVKIENSAEARPQTGLDQADIVYETLTEGGITRFNALYHSRSPKVVGPVRSARISDIFIVPQYGALFAHVGGNWGVTNRIKRGKLHDIDQYFNPAPYWRSRDRSAPHNMYMDIAKGRAHGIKARKYPATKELRPFTFVKPGESADASVPSAAALTVPFDDDNKVRWVYDAGSRTYARSINGKPHVDKGSGKQYRTRNIVVMWAKTQGAGKRDVAGSETLEITLSGTGRVSIFRDGRRFDGMWEADLKRPPRFVTEDGQVLRLTPGNSWVEVIPTDYNIIMG